MDENSLLWDNTHRAFLQAFLARQTLTFSVARPLLAKIQSAADPARPVPENDIMREDFEHYIQALNDAISPFDLEIRSTEPQSGRGEQIWALVNTTSDAMTQMSTSHSADEIAYVKKVIDAMFETNNTRAREVMAVSSMHALQLAREGGASNRRETGTQGPQPGTFNLTQSQAEKVLRSMVLEGWFEESPNSYFSLSPRALMELRGWLLDTYNDQEPTSDDEADTPHQKIKFCAACKALLTIGQRCPDLNCEGRLHNHCVAKMWAAQGRREECPVCKTTWVDPKPVGEKAARRLGRQSGGASGRVSGGRRRAPETNGAGEESDG